MMKAVMRDEREMKDSGIEWIGRYPMSWNLIANKYVMHKEKNLCLSWNHEDVLSLTMNGVIVRDLVNPTGKMPATFDGYQYINKGDLLMCLFDIDVTPRCVGRVFYNGVTSPAYSNFKMQDNADLGYYYYYYLMMDNSKELLHLAKNLRHSFTEEQLGQLKVPYPPIAEQQAIANYLDDRCSKIDAIIAEAKASIEEYKELKQAVITQAVTLGIKKKRPLKDTNILWIGKTPCDWQVAELKFFASIKSGITLGQKYPAGAKLVEIPYLRVANVQGEYVDLSDVKSIQVLPEEVDKYRLEAGVVLMTEGGDRDKLGRGCVWHGEIAPCLHQNHVFAVTTKSDKLLPEYFSHVTTSEVARCYFDYTAKKTTNLANTNSSTIMNFRLPIPPLEEQREIVKYLDKRIKTLNAMISEKQSLIEDLEAYKKSLIYEVVTGKRKVVA